MTHAPHNSGWDAAPNRRIDDSELDQYRHDGALLRSIVSERVKLKRHGKHWQGCCPFHDDSTPSFTVYDDGRFYCFGCKADGTVFDYIMRTEGVDFPAAVTLIAGERSTAKSTGNGQHKSDVWFPLMPPPPDAPKPTDEQLGACDMLHEYYDAEDRLLCYVRRHEAKAGRRKQFIPLTYGVLNGNRGWHDKAPDAPKPLYGLNRLSHASPDATMLLCEGEKKADAAQRMFPDMVAMSWMGGSSADGAADLSPLQQVRKVILWPDADKTGRDVMARIATHLPLARIIDTADLHDGFDAWDLEREGCDDPEAWLAARLKPFEPDAPPKQVGRLHILSVADLLTLPPRDYLVKGWLSPGELSLLVGAKNARKTFTALHVGYAVAQRRMVFGRRVKQAPVLYVIAEGEKGIAKRVKALSDRYGPCDDFHVIAQPVDLLHSDAARGDLCNLIQAARAYWDGLIIGDTVSRLLAGGDENGPADMGRFLDNLSILRHETGAHVMGVHHGTQADGIKSRGHSSLPFGVDAIAQLEWMGDGTGTGSLTLGFCRDDVTGPLGAFRTEQIVLGQDEDGDEITTLLLDELDPADLPAGGAIRASLSDAAKLAFRALCNLLAAQNADFLPAGLNCNDHTRGARLAQWRQEFYARSPTTPEDNDAPDERKRKKHLVASRFDRAVERLTTVQEVVLRDGWAWLPGPASE